MSPLFLLLAQIVYVVYQCVLGYFIAFKYCWALTGTWLVELVTGYYHLLEKLFETILAWPTVIVAALAMNGALFWVMRMLQIIFRFRAQQLAVSGPGCRCGARHAAGVSSV